jgi:phosphatidylserine/phosphatidylglycerophosphate/cardiolipin synthase-like enzyme
LRVLFNGENNGMNALVQLSKSNLELLRAGFAHGSLKYAVTREGLIQNGAPADVADALAKFISDREFSAEIMVAVIDAVLATRAHSQNVALSQTLVITGPDVPHSETLRTGSRFLQVVEHAKRELMLATFALYRGDQILEPIHQAMIRNPELRVTLILNISRTYGDRTLTSELVEKSRQDFLTKHWPWDRKPAVYYYPASLNLEAQERATMHAKFLIADEERCFITSANFTEAAQKRNIEVGVELANSQEPKALSRYFKQLINEGHVERIL